MESGPHIEVTREGNGEYHVEFMDHADTSFAAIVASIKEHDPKATMKSVRYVSNFEGALIVKVHDEVLR